MFRADASLLQEHYAHIASKPFFPEVENFMKSSPLIALAISGDNVVERVRDLLGPTDSTKAAKGFVRRVLDGQTADDAETLAIFAAAFAGQDFAEGAAAFVERRKPQFIA
mgnify:CR=1 FL=1